jgi:hypothetical protein
MRRLLFLSACVLSCSLADGFLPSVSSFGDGLDIQLQEAAYGDGTIKTEKGGIVKGKDFFLQAKIIEYTRTGEDKDFVHKLTAQGDLFLTYKGRPYKGDRAELDLTTGNLTVWKGITQSGIYYVGGKHIVVTGDGQKVLSDAYITTSENERNDWAITAKTATITKTSELQVQDATFYFVKMPLFWAPYFSTDLLHFEGDPFRYRVRWGGSEGLRFGISYLLNTGPVKNRALLDYSIKKGLGAGVRSIYRSADTPARFDALNYVAQGKGRTWDSARYRFEGCYRDYFAGPNLKLKAMYDKLSDRQMKQDFADHAVSDVRPGLTQATVWKEEPNWKASLNGRVRINDFQTIKQELPLFGFNQRPVPLGASRYILHNTFSAGYLDYVYAHHTPHVRDFASTRTELAQSVYATFRPSPFAITPTIGYHLIQYSNSPQHDSKLQAVGVVGIGAKTRLVHSGTFGQQILEPYIREMSMTRPPVQANRTFIFDIEDGWAQINQVRCGLRHNWYFPCSSEGFTPKLLSDLYVRQFFATKYISHKPYGVSLLSTLDATPKVSYKLDTEWDTQNNLLDHVNVAMRRTISRSLAVVLEWRQRSSYAWRKLDAENFIVEAVRSPHRLKNSEMSDKRRTALITLCWSPTRTLDIDFTSYYGFRDVAPRRYMNYEINLTTLVRGALRITISYFHRPGGPTNGFYFTCALGPKRESASTLVRKIGDGNYDIW